MLAHVIIMWGHIELAFEATTHIPAKYMRQRLMARAHMWQVCTDRDTTKRGTLTMLGLWSQPRQYKYRICCTMDTNDVLWTGEHATRPTPGSNAVYVDVISKIEQLSFTRTRPVHQLTLGHARRCVARWLYMTREVREPDDCLSIVIVVMFHQLGPRQLKQTVGVYKNRHYCDLANRYEHVEATTTHHHYSAAYPVPRETPIESEELVLNCYTMSRMVDPLSRRCPVGRWRLRIL